MSTEKKTKTGWIWLAALVVASSWASFETVRLAKATDQVAASQEQNLRVAARVEASRTRNAQVAHTETTPGTSDASAKR